MSYSKQPTRTKQLLKGKRIKEEQTVELSSCTDTATIENPYILRTMRRIVEQVNQIGKPNFFYSYYNHLFK